VVVVVVVEVVVDVEVVVEEEVEVIVLFIVEKFAANVVAEVDIPPLKLLVDSTPRVGV